MSVAFMFLIGFCWILLGCLTYWLSRFIKFERDTGILLIMIISAPIAFVVCVIWFFVVKVREF